mgnify:CR=1 FL=1
MLRIRTLAPLLLLSLAASTALAAPVFTRLGATGQRTFATAQAAAGVKLPTDDGAVLMSVDRDAVDAFRAAGGGTLELPTADGGTLPLELAPYELQGPGGTFTTSDATGRHPYRPDVSLFRGHVAGDTTSWVVLSMSSVGVLGTIERDGRRFMSDFDPRGELAPRDVVSRAINVVMSRTHHSNVYLDLSHLDPAEVHARFPGMAQICAKS